MHMIYLPLVCLYVDNNDIIVRLFIYTHILYIIYIIYNIILCVHYEEGRPQGAVGGRPILISLLQYIYR